MMVEREYQVPFETKLPLFSDGTRFQKNRKGKCRRHINIPRES